MISGPEQVAVRLPSAQQRIYLRYEAPEPQDENIVRERYSREGTALSRPVNDRLEPSQISVKKGEMRVSLRTPSVPLSCPDLPASFDESISWAEAVFI